MKAVKFCPYCGAQGCPEELGAAFLEAGEWDGKRYETEGDVTVYLCTSCRGEFYANLR